MLFLNRLNSMNLKYKEKVNEKNFISIGQLIFYLAGYRAFLIDWVNIEQKNNVNISKIVNRIEEVIDYLS